MSDRPYRTLDEAAGVRSPRPDELPWPCPPDDGGECCPAIAPGRDPWACTLEPGHDGPHAAHSDDDNRPVAVWP